MNIYVLFPLFPHCIFHQVHLRVLWDKSYHEAVEESSKKKKHQSVTQGSSRNCSFLFMAHCCWTYLGLTMKKAAVLTRSVSGGFRWWLQQPLCCWLLLTLKPCCHCAFSGTHLWREPHIFHFSLEKLFCDTTFIWHKCHGWCEWPKLLANVGWICWMMTCLGK